MFLNLSLIHQNGNFPKQLEYNQQYNVKIFFENVLLIRSHWSHYSVKRSLKHRNGEGNGNPLQHSCLENPMDRGAWGWGGGGTVLGVAQSQTQLSD